MSVSEEPTTPADGDSTASRRQEVLDAYDAMSTEDRAAAAARVAEYLASPEGIAAAKQTQVTGPWHDPRKLLLRAIEEGEATVADPEPSGPIGRYSASAVDKTPVPSWPTADPDQQWRLVDADGARIDLARPDGATASIAYSEAGDGASIAEVRAVRAPRVRPQADVPFDTGGLTGSPIA